ncbi:MAG: transporter substrate-binding domain-containing protein [Rhodobacteraceae bacterium]|nr:MAG: transporter substrate-binding domain-containing protein [Paracoccaceae bacterium]
MNRIDTGRFLADLKRAQKFVLRTIRARDLNDCLNTVHRGPNDMGETRMLKRHFLAGIAGLALAAVAVTGVQAKSLDDILSDGVIRIGINPNFPNMSTRNDAGEWEGFDIDVGKALAEAIGVEVEWVPTETPQRVPFLVSDRIDISLGALTRNTERAKLIDYTVPLHTEVLAVLATDKIEGDSWEDFNNENVTLANMRGNWTVDWIGENMPDAKLELVDTLADTVRLVGQGRADAIVENIDFFMAFTENYPDVNWRVVENPIFVAYCAIGVAQGNDNLTEVLNIALYNMHSSGMINETWEKFYGAPMLRKVEPVPYF